MTDELWEHLENIAETTCASLRKCYPGADISWRKQNGKIIVSWDGEDLHEISMESVADEDSAK